MEKDFVEGLKLCKNKSDIVGQLPVVGVGISIERTDKSMLDPWVLTVKNIS